MNTKRTCNPQEEAFSIAGAVAASFGSAARLKILVILAQAPRPVDTIASLTGESVANASQHLRRLFSEGLVSVEKVGCQRFYRLSSPQTALFLDSLFELASRISPDLRTVESVLHEDVAASPVDLAEIRARLAEGKAEMIDVREPLEAEHSPVPGARNLPLENLEREAKKLPRKKIYYLVCRGRLCRLATDGVKMLRKQGLEAYRLQVSPAQLATQEESHEDR